MTLPTLQNWKENVPGSLRCSIPSQQEKKGNKNNVKGKQKKLGQKEWKLSAKELLKPLHLSKSGMMLQSLLVHYLFIMKE